MKNIIILFCFITSVQTVFAQNENYDHVKAVLAGYTNPIERFSESIKYLESTDAYAASSIDSALSIDLLQIAQHLKNDSLLAISYNWIGYYFALSKGDNTIALEYYFKALPLAEKFIDKRRISSLYFDIATTYFFLNNIDEFFRFTKLGGENMPAKTSSKYDYMLLQFQRNMGSAYLEKNQLDSALNYAQAAVQTSDRLKLPNFQLQALHLLGAVNAKMNENDLADVYFKKALILSDSDKMETRRMAFYQRYIPFLFKNNRMIEAKVQVENLWILSGEIPNLNFKLIATTYKKELFDKLNNTDSAYYYSKVESEIRELIFNQNNLNTIQSLAFKEQLRTIEEGAKKSAEEDRRKKNIQYALIAIGIIILFTVYLLLSRSFITNTKLIEFFGIIALLIIFEFLNLLLHPYLERVTNHSPLLMLLSLVCIAALLVPLHHKVEKWATTKLVEKNKQIRLAAAKKTLEQLDKKDENL